MWLRRWMKKKVDEEGQELKKGYQYCVYQSIRGRGDVLKRKIRGCIKRRKLRSTHGAWMVEEEEEVLDFYLNNEYRI